MLREAGVEMGDEDDLRYDFTREKEERHLLARGYLFLGASDAISGFRNRRLLFIYAENRNTFKSLYKITHHSPVIIKHPHPKTWTDLQRIRLKQIWNYQRTF